MNTYNFSAGPSALVQWVKNKAYEEFLNYADKGFNIAEISHRSSFYEEINNQVHEDLLNLYGLSEQDYSVCLVQGGATAQFSLVASNFAKDASKNCVIDLIDTDIWTQKAASEQRLAKATVNIIASSKEADFSYIPIAEAKSSNEADFTYICSNNTVAGTQYKSYPTHLGDLIVDASSDFLSRPIDFSNVAVMFAGAQKNAGIAGIVPMIIRKDFIDRSSQAQLPAQFKYATHVAAKSLFNTPPTYAVYIFSLVLRWLKASGGLEQIDVINQAKAKRLYDYLDASEFYSTLVSQDRSLMNVCFKSPNAELDAKFVAMANERNLLGLKGHKSKGGLRASIYNACTDEAINALLTFCDEFKEKHC